MAAQWRVRIGNSTETLELTQLAEAVRTGKVGRTSAIMPPGSTQWSVAEDIPELIHAFAVVPSPVPVVTSAGHVTSSSAPTTTHSPPPHFQQFPAAVRVVDFEMPFFSMVDFMVKWVLASIPALIILVVVGAVLMSFVGGFLMTVFGGR